MKEPHVVVTDPLFRDARNDNFKFKSLKVVWKIGFKPVDYTKAGVYGSDEWIQKAQLSSNILDAFNEAALIRLKK